MDAFTAGINAWINTLSPADYPLEYKLLGHEPEAWSNIKSAAIALSMNRALNFTTNSILMSSLKAKWGEKAICAFYDTPPKYNEPVISRQNWDFPLVPPEPPKSDFIPQYILDAIVPKREPGVGSNNWAVSGNLTQSGFPILATDPHLSLTLPSVWYEMQINAPGVNAYGITFPGCVPSIAMGFNEKMAWGSTNTQNEVLDLYEIEFNESQTHYWYNNEWIPLKWRTETYTIKDGKTVIDSIAFTHHGPVMYMPDEKQYSTAIPIAHAISWAPLEACNFFKSYLQLNRAQNIDEFKHALRFLNAPTQNFGIATVSGDIAKQPNGLWPIKWEHQGMFISDGRNPEYDWKGFLPFEYLPCEVNPERGFVSSSNQNMATNYPFYHGNRFFGTTARPNIINRKLSANKSHTVEEMMELQLNCDNFWAQTYLDQMLDSLMAGQINHSAPDVHSTEYKSLQILKNWNRINEAESIAATIFDRWIKELDTLL